MKLGIEEKQILYVFGCTDYENTLLRLKWIASLTVDGKSKCRVMRLARWLDGEEKGEWYPVFYRQIRSEMDGYFEARHRIRTVEDGQ